MAPREDFFFHVSFTVHGLTQFRSYTTSAVESYKAHFLTLLPSVAESANGSGVDISDGASGGGSGGVGMSQIRWRTGTSSTGVRYDQIFVRHDGALHRILVYHGENSGGTAVALTSASPVVTQAFRQFLATEFDSVAVARALGRPVMAKCYDDYVKATRRDSEMVLETGSTKVRFVTLAVAARDVDGFANAGDGSVLEGVARYVGKTTGIRVDRLKVYGVRCVGVALGRKGRVKMGKETYWTENGMQRMWTLLDAIAKGGRGCDRDGEVS